METELIRKSRSYAEGVLKNLPKIYTYHNLDHTTQVVTAAAEIGKHSGLSDNDLESVLIAAWLHDTGYEQSCDHHEEGSILNAVRLLQEWGAPKEKLEQVRGLIKATCMPQTPTTVPEKVLCDADLSHLGDENIIEHGEQLRNEFETLKNLKFQLLSY